MAKEFRYLQRLVHDQEYELLVFKEGWISNKEIRILSGMLRYIEKNNLDSQAEIEINVAELNKSMEKAVGQAFDTESVTRFKEFSYILFSGKGLDLTITFSPKDLSHTISHISVYKKISEIMGTQSIKFST